MQAPTHRGEHELLDRANALGILRLRLRPRLRGARRAPSPATNRTNPRRTSRARRRRSGSTRSSVQSTSCASASANSGRPRRSGSNPPPTPGDPKSIRSWRPRPRRSTRRAGRLLGDAARAAGGARDECWVCELAVDAVFILLEFQRQDDQVRDRRALGEPPRSVRAEPRDDALEEKLLAIVRNRTALSFVACWMSHSPSGSPGSHTPTRTMFRTICVRPACACARASPHSSRTELRRRLAVRARGGGDAGSASATPGSGRDSVGAAAASSQPVFV